MKEIRANACSLKMNRSRRGPLPQMTVGT
jgi:hypothetical protein